MIYWREALILGVLGFALGWIIGRYLKAEHDKVKQFKLRCFKVTKKNKLIARTNITTVEMHELIDEIFEGIHND